MYNADLNLITKAKLQETQNVAQAQRPVKHYLSRRVHLVLDRLTHQFHLH